MFETQKPLSPHKYDAIHRALLTGLISNVGTKTDPHEHTGVRGNKFNIFPASALFDKPPGWIVSAELVQTSRLYARTVARVSPQWIEKAAEHLVKRTYGIPYWHRDSGKVLAQETVTLFGLMLIPHRTVHYGPLFPEIAREVFIYRALVEGNLRTDGAFYAHNQRLKDKAATMEAKARTVNLLTPVETRFAFYNSRIPAEIYSAEMFERWRHEAERKKPRLLFMQASDLIRPEADTITPELFPDEFNLDDLKLKLDYRFDVGSPADGITAVIPLAVLNRVPDEPFDWLVQGMVLEKIEALIRTLPKTIRVNFVPIPESAARAAKAMQYRSRPFFKALADELGKQSGLPILPDAFGPLETPSYLRMNFRIEDAEGKLVMSGRDLAAIRKAMRIEAQSMFTSMRDPRFHKDNIKRWDFGDLPQLVEVKHHGMTVNGYPTLVENDKKVSLRLLDSPDTSAVLHRAGVRRLFLGQVRDEIKYILGNIQDMEQLCLKFANVGTCDVLKDDLATAIADRALFDNQDNVRTQVEFVRRSAAAWRRLPAIGAELIPMVREIITVYHNIAGELSRDFPPLLLDSAKNMREQLLELVYPGFITSVPHDRLRHIPRYLNGILIRLRKLLDAGVKRDRLSMNTIAPLIGRYRERLNEEGMEWQYEPAMREYRWLLEELRISIFAQELKTANAVSAKKLEQMWEKVKGRGRIRTDE